MKLKSEPVYISDDGECEGSQEKVERYEASNRGAKPILKRLPYKWHTGETYNTTYLRVANVEGQTFYDNLSAHQMKMITKLANLTPKTVLLLERLIINHEKRAESGEETWYFVNMLRGLLDDYSEATK